MKAVLILVTAAVLAASSTHADMFQAYGGSVVQFVGQSGQIKLYPATNSQRFLKIQMGSLSETTASGAPTSNKIAQFASSSFTWLNPIFTTVQDVYNQTVNATTVSFIDSTLLVQGAPIFFSMNTTMYIREVVIQSGNQTVRVPTGSLKFTIKISGWPFLDTNNKLEFSINVLTSGGRASLLRTPLVAGQARFLFDQTGFIDVLDTALVDELERPITSSAVTTGPITSLSFTFPYFASTLVYDPVIGVDASGAACGTAPSLFLAALLVLAVLLLSAIF